MAADRTRFIIGCMTGTSLDGLDAVLAEIRGSGRNITATMRAMVSHPLGELAEDLRRFTRGQAAEPVMFLRAARRLGEVHAQAIGKLVGEKTEIRKPKSEMGRGDGTPNIHTTPHPGPLPEGEGVMTQNICATPHPGPLPEGEGVEFVVAHGQTIWHAPQEGLSWQLLDPWPIVRRWNVPVLYDLRQADLIAGGQGAPITPLSDWVLYRRPDRSVLVANLGGICNVTLVPAGGDPSSIRGGDIGPCNLLIDGLVRTLRPDLTFDEDGRLAAQGRAHPLVRELAQQSSPFYRRAHPRTTGREDFTESWVRQIAQAARAQMSETDVIASAVDAVAADIAEYARAHSGPVEVILAGGGAKNPVLVDRIRHRCQPDICVRTSDEVGIPVAAREALGFAVLGALCADGVPITLPAVTGATQPGVAGVWAGI